MTQRVYREIQNIDCVMDKILKKFEIVKFKGEVKSVLCIGSAHNKGGPADINIAQISHLSNFSDIKRWFVLIYEHNKPEQVDIQ